MGGSSNDDHSESMDPNNDAYDDSMDNHSNQLNPDNDEYQGGRQGLNFKAVRYKNLTRDYGINVTLNWKYL